MEPTMVRDLETVRRRRAELRDSIAMVRIALADQADSPVVWGERVQQELARLALDFAEHIDVTEGAGGLHETIVDSSPRLRHAVDELTAEHDEIEADIADVLLAVEPPVMARDVDAIRPESGIDMQQVPERPQQQAGADKEHERERDFCRNEDAAQPALTQSVRPAAFLQCTRDVGA